jgi:hypothetical protein
MDGGRVDIVLFFCDNAADHAGNIQIMPFDVDRISCC